MNSNQSPYHKLSEYEHVESETGFPAIPSAPNQMPNELHKTNPPMMPSFYGSPPMTVVTVASPGRNLSRAACAACNTGILRNDYSWCAWCLCCFFFPCGILCCLCMRRKKCSHCGVVY